MRALIVITAALVVTAGCDAFPRDPEGTLAAARGGTLRVGVAEASPWVVRDGERARGDEPALVEGFARSIGASIAWEWGPLDDHLDKLERFELAIVIGGLAKDSPWKKRVAFTRPYAGSRVMAVPPGENALLVALDAYLQEQAR